MSGINDQYGPLASEFYQVTKPIGDYYPDVPYYLEHLKKTRGRILEAAVGTGRLLVPLAKAGLKIEGADSSQEMLDYCRTNLGSLKSKPALHLQDLKKLKLSGEPFQAIILSFGSFQIFSDRKDAIQVMKKFHEHLAPGGKLYIDLDIPKLELHRAGIKVHGTSVPCADGSEILIEGSKTYSVVDQVESIVLRYEKWKKGKLLDSEIQNLKLRWYGVHEFKSFLSENAFELTSFCVDYDLENVVPTDFDDTLCFVAQKKSK